MKRNIFRFLIIILFFSLIILTNSYSYYWPIVKQYETREHKITSSFGEYRSTHFHTGIDIVSDTDYTDVSGVVGTKVYTLGVPVVGKIGEDEEYVRIGRFRYLHIQVYKSVKDAAQNKTV